MDIGQAELLNWNFYFAGGIGVKLIKFIYCDAVTFDFIGNKICGDVENVKRANKKFE